MKSKKLSLGNRFVHEALVREAFRKQAIFCGVADDCVIDKDGYAEISCVTGCFKNDNVWIVYDTDERSKIYGERMFKDVTSAYKDVARRLGFVFDLNACDTRFIGNIPSTHSLNLAKRPSYAFDDALRIVCESACAKFDETVELHIRLGVDSRRADQQVRGTVILPYGTGKSTRILVFAKGDNAIQAKMAGADFVGGTDLIEKIQREKWYDFDMVLAAPDMMNLVGHLGRQLGPKGLMPSPKAGTVTHNIAQAIQEIKSGRIEYRLDKTNNIHCSVGKVSFGPEKLVENSKILVNAIKKDKPATAKGQYVLSCVV